MFFAISSAEWVLWSIHTVTHEIMDCKIENIFTISGVMEIAPRNEASWKLANMDKFVLI